VSEASVSEAVVPGAVAVEAPPVRLSWALALALWRMDAAAWFLVLALPVCLYLAVAIPPGQGLDEPNHFFRVLQLSRGQVLAERSGDKVGGQVPSCVVAYLSQADRVATSPITFQWPAFATPAPVGCDASGTTFVDFPNTVVYSPVSYLPQVAGVIAARTAGAPLAWVFLAGRLAGLLAYAGLVFAALRIAPIGRTVILVVGLMPMALTSAAEYSADGMTLALALLLVAAVIRCCRDPQATWRTFAIAAAAAAGLALCKSTYFVLAPLLLVVPGRLFPSRATSIGARTAAVAAAALAAGGWYLAVGPGALAHVANGIDPHAQIRYILDHPLRYVRLVTMTVAGPVTPYFTWPGFVSWVGFTRNAVYGTPAPPILVVVAGFVAIAMAYRTELAVTLQRSLRTWVVASWPVILVVANVVLIITALYITDAAVGASMYWHVHGRYFLPLAAVPAVSVGVLAARPGQGASALPYAATMSLLLLYLVGKVAIYFY